MREAAAAAVSDADFFARLAAAGLCVGTRLAPDLSLPRVRERWSGPPVNPAVAPAAMWRTAEEKVRAAADQLGAGGLHQGAGDVAALGDLIVAAAVVSPYLVRSQIHRAAYEFERASRAPAARRMEGQARELYRESAQILSQSAATAGRNDAAAALGFLLALAKAIDASRRWHQAQEHRAQAEASGRAGRLLREAVEVTTGASAARDYRPRPKRTAARPTGVRRAPVVSGERPMAGVVQQALPEHARMVLADPAWPALRTRLVALEETGEDPVDVLAAVAARRELGTAGSVAEVLSWRLDGWQRQRGATVTATGKSPSATSTGGTGRTGPARTTGAPAPGRRPPGDEQRKGPKRAR